MMEVGGDGLGGEVRWSGRVRRVRWSGGGGK